MPRKSKLKFPPWLRIRVRAGANREDVNKLVGSLGLNTVCQEAQCPNLAECWHNKTATFMILGDVCTRNCSFCAVKSGNPNFVDPKEPEKVAEAAKKMDLKYVVITSVTRDDLEDQGAEHFVRTIKEINKTIPNVKVEVLTPDFNANEDLLYKVFNAQPTVFNHNIETVQRLSKKIRSKANFETSIKVLKSAVEFKNRSFFVKSGFMVGLGEKDNEVLETIKILSYTGLEILTIGQYLPPSTKHASLDRYVHPDTFLEWKLIAEKLGIKHVFSAPLVRSSYMAGTIFNS